MTVEELKAEIDALNTYNDEFYRGLGPILNGWLTLSGGVRNATTGTSQDVTAIHARLQDGSDAIHLALDASIYLGQALTAFAAIL
ncbi:hypothetical protein AB5J62_29110 [Amycolatopsis sp. cg5]|uniref:hypothetical protein n=1 Tax=Amycolatopsis sp. cg5 TaxID=3238802 RepID=UPI003524D714